VLIYTATSVFTALMSYLMVLFHRAYQVEEKHAINLKELFKLNNNLLLIALAAVITQQISTLVLGNANLIAEVAVFSLAVKITALLGFVIIAMNSITGPQYAKLFSNNKLIEFWVLFRKSRKILTISGLLLAIVLMIMTPVVTSFLDPGYSNLPLIVAILLVGQLANLMTGSVVNILVMTNHDALHRKNTFVISLLTVLLVIIFIPRYGIIAAAVIMSLTMLVKNLVSLYYVQRLIDNPSKA
jgi:O-antigen/teichoic acid export membrane protein